MATKSKLKSDLSEAIYASAAMLHKVGAMDKTTMLDFDARHLVPSPIAPAKAEPGLSSWLPASAFWGFALIIRANHRVIGGDYCLCSD